MNNTNWKNVEAGGSQPTKGGYICQIIAVEDDEKREFLKIHLDIAEGEYAGYFKDLFDRFGFYGLTHVRSYKETAKGLFKKFLTFLEESNNGFVADEFNNNPQALVGLRVGAVLRLRRYTKKNGLDGTQLRADSLCTVGDILSMNFTVPDDLDERNKVETAVMPQMSGSHATTGPNYGFVNVTEGSETEGLPFM